MLMVHHGLEQAKGIYQRKKQLLKTSSPLQLLLIFFYSTPPNFRV